LIDIANKMMSGLQQLGDLPKDGKETVNHEGIREMRDEIFNI